MPEAKTTSEDRMNAMSGAFDKMCDRLDKMGARMDAFMSKHAKKDAKRAAADEGETEPEEMASDDSAPDPDDEDEAPKPKRKAMTDSEKENALLEQQTKADHVARHWGRRAPQPMMGERLPTYRRRLAGMFKQHSPDFKSADLSLIRDPQSWEVAERQIYADAIRASSDNSAQPRGVLREVIREDQSGRRISEFVGSVGVTLEPFRLTPMRVKHINKNPDAYLGG
jgi:hypothetical protein